MAQIHLSTLRRPFGLATDRGSVMAEYAVLLTVVSLALVAATVALGVPLVNWYAVQRIYLLLPVP